MHERLTQTKSRRRIMENYVLVWLDATIDKSKKDFCDSFTQLQSIVSTIDIYTDVDQCIKYLEQLENEQIFVIVSGAVSQIVIPRIHGLPQIDSIFVFCHENTSYEQWATEWCKIKGIFIRMDKIYDSLREAAHLCDQNSVSVSFLPASEVSTKENVIQIDPTFMFTQLLKETLLELYYDESRFIPLFAEFSRSRCIDNATELSKIEQFEHNYRDHTPIWWYTCECSFLYRTLNRALGNLDVNTILMMGFFIQHLHQHITQLYNEQKPSDPATATPFFVYRGQGLSTDDFNKLKNSETGLMSFNNFLSTSEEQRVAIEFIERVRVKAVKIPVLFVITIDPSTIMPTYSTFARINQISYFENEKEILFSMNSVFRVDGIQEMEGMNKGLWQVNLTLTSSDSDPAFAALIDHLRAENTGTEGLSRLAQVLIKLSNFDRAREIYEACIEISTDEKWTASSYFMLGNVEFGQGEYNKAISLYESAIEIYQKDLSVNLSDLASSYNNIGLVYWTIGNYPQALLFYAKALEIKQQLFPSIHQDLASTYVNIGLVYYNMGEFTKAVSYYEKAVDIQKIVLPMYHPNLAQSYLVIATAYEKLDKFKESLEYYDKAIDIQKKSLPPEHPSLATSYNNLGEVYRNMGDYSKALSYYEQALKMKEKCLSSTHPEMASSYNNIANLHFNMGDYTKALFFYEKQMEIQENYLPTDHPDIITFYMNKGNVYYCMGEYSIALSCYEKSFEIQEKVVPPNLNDLLYYFNNLGELYCGMGNYSQALSSLQRCLEIFSTLFEDDNLTSAFPYHNLGKVHQSLNDYTTAMNFYQKTLAIREQLLPAEHPDLANTYTSIGDIHRIMGQYEVALSFHRKALHILENVTCNVLDTALVYSNLGETFRKMQDYSSALMHHSKALDIRQKRLPKMHPNLAATHHYLAQVHYANQWYDLAIEHIRFAIEIGQEKLPEEHPDRIEYTKTLETIKKNL